MPSLPRRLLGRPSSPLVLSLLPLVLLSAFVALSSHQLSPHLTRWTCRMSWMSPSYIQFPIKNRGGWEDQWRLFLYREKGWDVTQTPDGQPVLYIPGNAGSYQQARSIASSAAHQFYEEPFVPNDYFRSRGLQSLDVFTVDFNEALSAFHGSTLLAQSAYVAHCADFILHSAYSHLPQDKRPRQVILFGHSMGGIIARHAATRLEGGVVQTIVTLSTPHQFPPVTTDSTISSVYADIAFFHSTSSPISKAKDQLLISICGGSPDPTLPSDPCAIPGSQAKNALGVFTSGMPGVWTGVEHEAMVWCHQVRWRVARVLLELGRHEGLDERRRVGQEWLVGAEPKQQAANPLDEQIKKVELGATGRFEHHQIDGETIYLFPVDQGPSTFYLLSPYAVSSIGPQDSPSATFHHCSSMTSSSCRPISPKSVTLLPPSPTDGSHLRVGAGVNENDGLVWSEFDVESGWVGVRVGGEGWGVGQVAGSGGKVEVRAGSLSSLFGFKLHLPSDQQLRIAFKLPSLLSHSLLVYKATFSAPSYGESAPLFGPLLRHTTLNSASPATHESALYPSPSIIYLHSHSSNAPFLPPPDQSAMTLEYWSDPTVGGRTEVWIRLDVYASLGRLVLRYRMAAVGWMLGTVGVILSLQARKFRVEGRWPSILEVYTSTLRQYASRTLGVLTALQLVQVVTVKLCDSLGWTRLTALASSALLGNHHFVFCPLPAFIAAAVAGLVSLVLVGTGGFLRTAAWVGKRVDKKGWILALPSVDEETLAARKRQALPVLVVLAIVATLVPYQVAVLVLFLVHSLSTISSASPETTTRSVTDHGSTDPTTSSARAASRSNLYQSIHALLLCLLPVNAPALVVWVRDLPATWKEPFVGDHNVFRIVGVAAVVVAAHSGRSLTHTSAFQVSLRLLEACFWTLAAVAFIFGSRYLFQVFNLANLSLAVLAWTLRFDEK